MWTIHDLLSSSALWEICGNSTEMRLRISKNTTRTEVLANIAYIFSGEFLVDRFREHDFCWGSRHPTAYERDVWAVDYTDPTRDVWAMFGRSQYNTLDIHYSPRKCLHKLQRPITGDKLHSIRKPYCNYHAGLIDCRIWTDGKLTTMLRKTGTKRWMVLERNGDYIRDSQLRFLQRCGMD